MPIRREERERDRSASAGGGAGDVVQLVLDYAKQETLEPLKGAGRFVAFGVVGAIAISAGTMLLLLGGLRALQTETGSTFRGNWSWAPYLITAAAAVIVAGLAAWRIRKGPAARRKLVPREGA